MFVLFVNSVLAVVQILTDMVLLRFLCECVCECALVCVCACA